MDRTLDTFTSELASKTPVPGGGGAAALTAALASALGSMTANYTIGKKKYAEYDGEMAEIIEECAALRVKALELIKRDAEAFEPLSAAYSLPKDAQDRDSILEKCLYDAATAPMEIARLASRFCEIADVLSKHGSVLMISDAGCSAVLARAALECAAMNVMVNTRLMKNREVAESMNSELSELLGKKYLTSENVFQRLT